MNPVNTLVGRRLLNLVFFMLIPVLAHGATTYYVAKTGSDNYSCADAQYGGTAKLTIAAGIGCLSGGDTLIIGDGIYPEGARNTIPSGSPGAPTIIQAANRNAVTMRPDYGAAVINMANGSYITIDGIDADGINVSDAVIEMYSEGPQSDHIVIQNGTVRNGNSTYGSGISGAMHDSQFLNLDVHHDGDPSNPFAHGFYVSGARNIIDGNRIYANGAYAIHLYSGDFSGIDNNIIRNNEIYDHPWRSVIITAGSQNQFYNNLVYRNGRGLEIHAYSQTVIGNTIHSNGNYCIALYHYGHRVESNSCYSNELDSIYDLSDSSVTVNNLFGVVTAAPSAGSSGSNPAGGPPVNTEGNTGGSTDNPVESAGTSGGTSYTGGDQLAAPTVAVSQCNDDGTFTLSWDSVPGADNYYVRIDYQNDRIWESPDYYLDGYGSTVITGSVISGQYYGWWVHAANSREIGPHIYATFICE